jgi:hypothetical protein
MDEDEEQIMAHPTMPDIYTKVSVEYWEAQVDSWLAQLAEIRNLSAVPDRHDLISPARCAPQLALGGGGSR